jgi:hypothetical protein
MFWLDGPYVLKDTFELGNSNLCQIELLSLCVFFAYMQSTLLSVPHALKV